MPLCCFSRGVLSNGSGHTDLTNQRRQFDIECTGKWLASGNQVWDLETPSIFLPLSDHYLAVLAITARTDCNV